MIKYLILLIMLCIGCTTTNINEKNYIPISYIESGINLKIINDNNYNIEELTKGIIQKLSNHNVIINSTSDLVIELIIKDIDFGNQAIRLLIGPIDGGVGKLDYSLRIYNSHESFVNLQSNERFTGLEGDFTGENYINNLGGEKTVQDVLYKNLSDTVVIQLLNACK